MSDSANLTSQQKILVVGAGSIGLRHAQNFASFGCDVAFVSQRKDLKFKTFESIQKALSVFIPDTVVIANKTVDHITSLKQILTADTKSLIIVEKPLFSIMPNPELILTSAQKQNIKVAYNLRFHPLVSWLRQELKNEKVLNALFYVGQYLPTWRPQDDYRKSYSALKNEGGGVLRDLSHEIDMGIYLFGAFKEFLFYSGKVSSLEIQSDDTFMSLARFKSQTVLNLNMNYLDRIKQRFYVVNTDQDSFKIDFMAKTAVKNDQVLNFNIDGNTSYLEMTKDILFLRAESLCSYDEAIQTVQLFDRVDHDGQQKDWIQL